VAVLAEIKASHPKAQIRFWCDYKFAEQARSKMHNFDKNIPVSKIVAGKLRRYNHVSMFRQLFWPTTVLLNIRDIFLTLIGVFQCLIKLIIWRPDVVFAKGGYVCLPIGFAAHLLRIPLVIHDSDAHPGLTNRILGRWASAIATGAPLEYYSYSKNKAVYTGIPVSTEFHEFSKNEQIEAKKRWGVATDRPLIVVTGGGLGAQRINDATVMALDSLMHLGSVILVSGAGQYDELRSITPPNGNRFQLHSFVAKDMSLLLGAADVVITRAGATTIFELAALVKPTILIPNGMLTGGHQLKNAAVYEKGNAVKVIDESDMIKDPQILATTVREIIHSPKASYEMAKRFETFVRPNAARDVADMIISSVK
jgi:UDP-N-acetylglucosamine--N-acetylmuramyl-(pentapeptide) pyrophosphoryl-undecaprenol N-acetylglucosamine transferase